jgi:hypothetical protein
LHLPAKNEYSKENRNQSLHGKIKYIIFIYGTLKVGKIKNNVTIFQLISLKAELSRKQEEVSLAKSQQQFVKPSTSDKSNKKKGNIWDKKSIGIESKKDELTEEEQDSYSKSR